MTLQPEDFWSFGEWLLRPESFLESALLQGIVLVVFAILLGLLVGYLVSALRYGPGEGFYAMARSVRDLIRFDLPGTSFSRTLALARLAYKEAIRRRVLVVVGLFVVGLLFAGWYLDPRSSDPARLYISFVLTATNYLILLLALFISTFSLPADIKSRTIYTIVTKPVRATEIVLGRMIGFVAVGTLMLVPMAIASYFFVTRGLHHDHEVVDVKDLGGGRFEGKLSYDQFHEHTFTIDPPAEPGQPSLGYTDAVRGHRHVVRQEDGKFYVGDPTGALRARIPSYGSLVFTDRTGNLDTKGIDVGNEKGKGGYGGSGIARLVGVTSEARRLEYGYMEGSTLGSAIYTFYDVNPSRYPDEEGIPLEMSLRAFRTIKGDIVSGLNGSITLRNPDNPKVESKPITFVVQEYDIAEERLPRQIEGTDGGGTRQLDLFKDLVTDDGRLEIIIRCLDRNQYLGTTVSGVYLRPAESSFAWNLTKSYLSIWLQMVMVIAFGVMFSTFLSGPVAMVATFVCVLLGFTAEQIYDIRYYLDRGEAMGGGPVESMVRLLRQDAMTTELDVDAVAGKIIKTVDAGIIYSLDAIATSLPNLPKMLSTAEYAASGFDIFGSLLARHAVATFGYVILAFLIGYFFLKTREIAA
jgi:ABC-type transport system involved in multi-copper enzyme maturation permease subunit